jgi:X-domain of DnaJ-containing
MQDTFLKLHFAYDTLYDDEKRKAYDEWGPPNDNASPYRFDTYLFFDILFGFSPELEPYIGDLAIKSFANGIQQFCMAVEQRDPQQQQERLEEWFDSFVWNGRSYLRESRQVDIALHLVNFTEEYVHGSMSLLELKDKSTAEAKVLLQSTQFPNFVETVGRSLYWEGTGHFQDFFRDTPFFLAAWTRTSFLQVKGNLHFLAFATSLLRQYRLQAAKLKNGMQNNEKNASYMNEQVLGGLLQQMLPSIVDFIRRYNEQDIARTIQMACWKILRSCSLTASTTERRRQAEALRIVGSSFLDEAQSGRFNDAGSQADEAVAVPTNECLQARVEVAFELATGTRKRSQRWQDVESMIQSKAGERLRLDKAGGPFR